MMTDNDEITDELSFNENGDVLLGAERLPRFRQIFRSFTFKRKKEGSKKLSRQNIQLTKELQEKTMNINILQREVKTKDDNIRSLKQKIKELFKQNVTLQSENGGLVERVIEIINKHSRDGCNVYLQIGNQNKIELSAIGQRLVLELDKRMEALMSVNNTLTGYIANLQIDLKSAKETLRTICGEVRKLRVADDENSAILIRMQENISCLFNEDVSGITSDGLEAILQNTDNFNVDEFQFAIADQAGQRLIRYIVSRYGPNIYWLRQKWAVPINIIENIAPSNERLLEEVCSKMLFWVIKEKGWKPNDVIASFEQFDSWVKEEEKKQIKFDTACKKISDPCDRKSDLSADSISFFVGCEAMLYNISAKLDECKSRDEKMELDMVILVSKVLNAVAEDEGTIREVNARRSSSE